MVNDSRSIDLTNQDEKNPGIVEKMKNNPVVRKVLLTLGTIGVMATTDTSAQNIAGNSLPTTPTLESTETTGVILTNAEVIALLQSNKDKLIQKYPSLKDETIWLKVIGTIATGVAKKETIDYLAGAFDKNTDENKKLIAFGDSLGVSKHGKSGNTRDPEGMKKPALTSKEKREMKENEKKMEEYLKQFNAVLADEKKWNIKHGECKKFPKGIFQLTYKPEKKGDAETMGTAQYYSSLPTGDYEIDYSGTGGAGMILWTYNKAGETMSRTILVDGINKINISPDCVKIGFGASALIMSPFQLNKLSIKKISELSDTVVTTK